MRFSCGKMFAEKKLSKRTYESRKVHAIFALMLTFDFPVGTLYFRTAPPVATSHFSSRSATFLSDFFPSIFSLSLKTNVFSRSKIINRTRLER